jgi:multiple sugar transport system ATP-binding protein
MLTARYIGELSLHAGDRVSLVPDPTRIHRFDESGKAIRG